MKEYEYRVVLEREALGEKVNKLTTYCNSGKFNDIPEEHQVLLRKQLDIMYRYLDVLGQRINLFIEEG